MFFLCIEDENANPLGYIFLVLCAFCFSVQIVFADRFVEKVDGVLHPHTIIVYGSANYPCFDELKSLGINIVAYPSQMSMAFDRRKSHE